MGGKERGRLQGYLGDRIYKAWCLMKGVKEMTQMDPGFQIQANAWMVESVQDRRLGFAGERDVKVVHPSGHVSKGEKISKE